MEIFPRDEIKRKAFHLLTMIYIATYWFFPRYITLWGMGIAIIIVTVAEMLRLREPEFNRWLLNALGGVHREDEVGKVSVLLWTLSGSLFTMYFFNNRHIVIVSLLYLALGDAIAAVIGKHIGRTRIFNGKTLEGSLACFAICFAIGLIFLDPRVALIGAILAAIIEVMPWPLNDNFWMPPVSAALLTMLITVVK
jgi:dolichol kinase